MELYKEYIKERENREVVYDDHCFLTYEKDEDSIIVFDIYSDKEVRGTKYMLDFCNKFYNEMKGLGIKHVYGMTDISTNGWKRSEQLLIKYGFKFMGTDPENTKVRNYYFKLNTGEV